MRALPEIYLAALRRLSRGPATARSLSHAVVAGLRTRGLIRPSEDEDGAYEITEAGRLAVTPAKDAMRRGS